MAGTNPQDEERLARREATDETWPLTVRCVALDGSRGSRVERKLVSATLDGKVMTLVLADSQTEVWRPTQWGAQYRDAWDYQGVVWTNGLGQRFGSLVRIVPGPGMAIRVSGNGLVPSPRRADVGVEVKVRAQSRGRGETRATFELVTPSPESLSPSGRRMQRQQALRGSSGDDEWWVDAGQRRTLWHGSRVSIDAVPAPVPNPQDEERLARRSATPPTVPVEEAREPDIVHLDSPRAGNVCGTRWGRSTSDVNFATCEPCLRAHARWEEGLAPNPQDEERLARRAGPVRAPAMRVTVTDMGAFRDAEREVLVARMTCPRTPDMPTAPTLVPLDLATTTQVGPVAMARLASGHGVSLACRYPYLAWGGRRSTHVTIQPPPGRVLEFTTPFDPPVRLLGCQLLPETAGIEPWGWHLRHVPPHLVQLAAAGAAWTLEAVPATTGNPQDEERLARRGTQGPARIRARIAPIPGESISVRVQPDLEFRATVWPPGVEGRGPVVDADLVRPDETEVDADRAEITGLGQPVHFQFRRGPAVDVELRTDGFSQLALSNFRVWFEHVQATGRTTPVTLTEVLVTLMSGPAGTHIGPRVRGLAQELEGWIERQGPDADIRDLVSPEELWPDDEPVENPQDEERVARRSAGPEAHGRIVLADGETTSFPVGQGLTFRARVQEAWWDPEVPPIIDAWLVDADENEVTGRKLVTAPPAGQAVTIRPGFGVEVRLLCMGQPRGNPQDEERLARRAVQKTAGDGASITAAALDGRPVATLGQLQTLVVDPTEGEVRLRDGRVETLLASATGLSPVQWQAAAVPAVGLGDRLTVTPPPGWFLQVLLPGSRRAIRQVAREVDVWLERYTGEDPPQVRCEPQDVEAGPECEWTATCFDDGSPGEFGTGLENFGRTFSAPEGARRVEVTLVGPEALPKRRRSNPQDEERLARRTEGWQLDQLARDGVAKRSSGRAVEVTDDEFVAMRLAGVDVPDVAEVPLDVLLATLRARPGILEARPRLAHAAVQAVEESLAQGEPVAVVRCFDCGLQLRPFAMDHGDPCLYCGHMQALTSTGGIVAALHDCVWHDIDAYRRLRDVARLAGWEVPETPRRFVP